MKTLQVLNLPSALSTPSFFGVWGSYSSQFTHESYFQLGDQLRNLVVHYMLCDQLPTMTRLNIGVLIVSQPDAGRGILMLWLYKRRLDRRTRLLALREFRIVSLTLEH